MASHHTKVSVDGRVFIQIRLDPDLLKRVEVEAETRGVSRNYVIIRAVNEWMEEHEGAA